MELLYKLNTSNKKLLFGVTATVAMASLLFASVYVSADIDPVACTDNGGGVSVAAFRADGITNIGGGTVTDGEMINYRATLFAAPLPNCAFEGGTWTLTTPNGVVHPLGVVPRIGGTGVASFSSALIPYTVNHANEVVDTMRHIDASTNYAGGMSHADTNDETTGPTLGASKILKVMHAPTVTTNIHNTAHGVITSAPTGATVHDNAVVTGQIGGPMPTGTVDFNVFNNTTCSASPASTQSNVALVDASAESNATVVPNTGMSYMAHYDGDSNYNPADGICEPLTATKLTPTVVTDIHNASEQVVTSVPEGSVVHDKATVSGSGPMPTGNVDFTFFMGANCSASSSASGVSVVDGAGVAHPSTSQGPLTPGSYSFLAHYQGDINYLEANAGCENLTVTANGRIVVDKITNPSGSAQSFTFNTTGTGYNGFSLMDTDAPNSQTLSPGTYSVSEAVLAGWTQTSVTCMSSNQNVENPASISLQSGETVTCTFTNTRDAVQYCSPGYWKQNHHFDSYVGYSPNDFFSTVFGESITIMWGAKGKPQPISNPTLLQVLEANGGGLSSLARATVGALLNASALNSGYTTAQVISMFNATYPGSNSDYEALKAQFTGSENCPLN